MNLKALYQYINCKTQPKEYISNLSRKDDTLTIDDLGKAEVLSEIFGVFLHLRTLIIYSFTSSYTEELNFITVKSEQVKNKLNKLNPCKAPGPDGFNPRVLKELAEVLAYCLCKIFNKSIEIGDIPKEWKMAEVKLIFKKRL